MTVKVGIWSMNKECSPLYIQKVIPCLGPIEVLERTSEVLYRFQLIKTDREIYRYTWFFNKLNIQRYPREKISPTTQLLDKKFDIKFEMALNQNKFIIVTMVSVAVFLAVISTSVAQGMYNYYAEKPGSCPPPLPVQICNPGCYVDGHCRGNQKCCPTSCGGTVCSIPVTMRRPVPVVKAGSCPVIPTGRWVCTPTCSTDGDCPGSRKCCKNRCGAMACQKPQTDVADAAGGADQPVPNPFLVYMN